MKAIQESVAMALSEALKQMQMANVGAGTNPGAKGMRETVDTVVKRTDKFTKDGFHDWKFRIEMSVKGSCGKLHEFMQWAEGQELFIDPETSVPEPDRGYNANLYYILAQRTDGEAFDVVKNVMNQNGGEAWRKLCRIFSGKTRGKRLHLIRKCVNPPKIKKFNEVPGMFESWRPTGGDCLLTSRRN